MHTQSTFRHAFFALLTAGALGTATSPAEALPIVEATSAPFELNVVAIGVGTLGLPNVHIPYGARGMTIEAAFDRNAVMPVPEPAGGRLGLAGLLLMVAWRRWQTRRAAGAAQAVSESTSEAVD